MEQKEEHYQFVPVEIQSHIAQNFEISENAVDEIVNYQSVDLMEAIKHLNLLLKQTRQVAGISREFQRVHEKSKQTAINKLKLKFVRKHQNQHIASLLGDMIELENIKTDINNKPEELQNDLFRAIVCNNFDIVFSLLKAGLNFDLPAGKLQFAIEIASNNIVMIKLILDLISIEKKAQLISFIKANSSRTLSYSAVLYANVNDFLDNYAEERDLIIQLPIQYQPQNQIVAHPQK